MAKFHGVVGYGSTVEKAKGVWEDVIVEKVYYGDVLRLSRELQAADKVNKDIVVSHTIEIMADAYAYEHYEKIRYILWEGRRWEVSSVEVRRPRLAFRLGDLYNGPTA